MLVVIKLMCNRSLGHAGSVWLRTAATCSRWPGTHSRKKLAKSCEHCHILARRGPADGWKLLHLTSPVVPDSGNGHAQRVWGVGAAAQATLA
jgi:hypothetical protein